MPALLRKLATEAPDVHVHVDHFPREKQSKRLERGELDFHRDLVGHKASIEAIHLLTDDFALYRVKTFNGREPTVH